MLLTVIIFTLFLLKMTLRGARILSSCNDASNRQEQKMNVNIRVEEGVKLPRFEESLNSKHNNPQTIPQQPIYPTVNSVQQNPVNFTMQEQQTPEPSQYPSVVANPVLTRDINEDLAKDLQIQDLETKNKFLNLLLTVYQQNPLYINSYVVCPSQLLMELIKLLTKCDRVDLVLNEDLACGGCTGDNKLIYISKILVVNGDETKDLKYGYNDVYSKLIAYGISLKIVC